MRLVAFAGLLGLLAGPADATTLYLLGNCTSCTFTAPSTQTYVVQAWGAGAGGNDTGNSQGGRGGTWGQLNTFSATGATAYNIQLGAPGVSVPLSGGAQSAAGGDTWFNSTSTLLVNGGVSSTPQAGSSNNPGGFGGSYTSGFGYPGASGAGAPGQQGGYGGNGCVTCASGGGGGANTNVGSGNTPTTATGGAGQNSTEGNAGGAGGFSVGAANGSVGAAGAGGGGGYGSGGTGGNGGNGGDDYDNGGGGAGGPGAGSGNYNGGNGGTPGGGGTYGTTSGTQGIGGYGEIKITYAGTTDPDQIYVWGKLTTVQIPASWLSTATAKNTTASCTTTTIPVTPGAPLTVAVQAGCQPLVLTKITTAGGSKQLMLQGVGQ